MAGLYMEQSGLRRLKEQKFKHSLSIIPSLPSLAMKAIRSITSMKSMKSMK